uniref:Uncharacterized protein n=1 Tax=Anopheles quadriannulatus TaxID=34691 RepID=A0A182XRK8_ANOQN
LLIHLSLSFSHTFLPLQCDEENTNSYTTSHCSEHKKYTHTSGAAVPFRRSSRVQ